MIEFLTFVAVAISLPAMILGLLQLVAPRSPIHEGVRRGLARFKLWQLMVVVIICGLLFSMMTVRERIVPFMLIVLIVLGSFMKTWRDEFVYLMGLRDSDFPGRNDKLIWVATLLLLAPVGAWFFRSYRLEHWPESEAEGRAFSEPTVKGSTFPDPTSL